VKPICSRTGRTATFLGRHRRLPIMGSMSGQCGIWDNGSYMDTLCLAGCCCPPLGRPPRPGPGGQARPRGEARLSRGLREKVHRSPPFYPREALGQSPFPTCRLRVSGAKIRARPQRRLHCNGGQSLGDRDVPGFGPPQNGKWIDS
jgi:hypothetical protein